MCGSEVTPWVLFSTSRGIPRSCHNNSSGVNFRVAVLHIMLVSLPWEKDTYCFFSILVSSILFVLHQLNETITYKKNGALLVVDVLHKNIACLRPITAIFIFSILGRWYTIIALSGSGHPGVAMDKCLSSPISFHSNYFPLTIHNCNSI